MTDLDRYDPNTAPEPKTWLALDSARRMELAKQAHSPAEPGHPAIKNLQAHAMLHTLVENQAADDVPGVRATLERLVTSEHLTRHEAVHAVGSVAVKAMQQTLQSGSATQNADDYVAELAKLEGAPFLFDDVEPEREEQALQAWINASPEEGGDGALSVAAEPPEPARQFVREVPEPDRNAPCFCGSGRKYKKCHLGKTDA